MNRYVDDGLGFALVGFRPNSMFVLANHRDTGRFAEQLYIALKRKKGVGKEL
jgi:hypothetical protein